jgi:uncharacterized protein with PIN domain
LFSAASEKRLAYLSPEIVIRAFPYLLVDMQREMQKRLAEREVQRLQNEKNRLANMTDAEVLAGLVVRTKIAAQEQLDELLRQANQKLANLTGDQNDRNQ